MDSAALIRLLEQEGFQFACERHRQVSNMSESEALQLSLQGLRCKNLLLRDKQGRNFLVMTTADKSLDLAAAAATLGSKRLSFASAQRLDELLGVCPGALSPLALVNDAQRQVSLVIDRALDQDATFLLHPLDSSATVGLPRPDLDRFLDSIGHPPTWAELKARAPQESDPPPTA